MTTHLRCFRRSERGLPTNSPSTSSKVGSCLGGEEVQAPGNWGKAEAVEENLIRFGIFTLRPPLSSPCAGNGSGGLQHK